MPQELIYPVETSPWPPYERSSSLFKWSFAGQRAAAGPVRASSSSNPRARKTNVDSYFLTWHSSIALGALITIPTTTRIVLDSKIKEWLRFQSLMTQWRKERGAMSSITEMSTCPAYQAIIGMGETAIPLILSQLRSEDQEPDQWFWALQAITAVHPDDDSSGDYVKMAEWWLRWGAVEGYARW